VVGVGEQHGFWSTGLLTGGRQAARDPRGHVAGTDEPELHGRELYPRP